MVLVFRFLYWALIFIECLRLTRGKLPTVGLFFFLCGDLMVAVKGQGARMF